tara:strand:- start:11043 stop:11285 length:243 start_codon:yes stop_codon:yes gene_type:complete
MDFSTTFSTADKRAMLQRAMASIENEVHEVSWRAGQDPDDLSVDFTAPADADGNKLAQDVLLEKSLAKWKACKAKLDALG